MIRSSGQQDVATFKQSQLRPCAARACWLLRAMGEPYDPYADASFDGGRHGTAPDPYASQPNTARQDYSYVPPASPRAQQQPHGKAGVDPEARQQLMDGWLWKLYGDGPNSMWKKRW